MEEQIYQKENKGIKVPKIQKFAVYGTDKDGKKIVVEPEVITKEDAMYFKTVFVPITLYSYSKELLEIDPSTLDIENNEEDKKKHFDICNLPRQHFLGNPDFMELPEHKGAVLVDNKKPE